MQIWKETLPDTIAGGWKFRFGEKVPFSVTTQDLTDTAIAFVKANPGGGEFYDSLYIRGSGKDEIGLFFVYKLGPSEGQLFKENLELFLKPYEDFFRRRHGAAFKGHSIGSSVIEVIINKKKTA